MEHTCEASPLGEMAKQSRIQALMFPPRCGLGPARFYHSSCLHEHIRHGWLCVMHATMPGICRDCLFSREPHGCLLTVTEEEA